MKENRLNVLVAGAGQLGSRHLQGLVPSRNPLNIWAYDPSTESLSVAEQRFTAVAGYDKHSFQTSNDLSAIGTDHFDLVIIATNSSHRLKVFSDIAAKFQVKFVVFEKVLFPAIGEFNEAGALLKKYNIEAWVNCPRRMYPFYNEVKTAINGQEKVYVEVVGNNWGLACNTIHFADLYAFLCDEDELVWDNSGLDIGWADSKRKGYKEFFGSVEARSAKGSISLRCYDSGPVGTSIRITSPEKRWVINEALGSALYEEVNESNAWVQKQLPFEQLFQSQLTWQVADSLFEKGTCALTTFNESASLHIPFISSLLNHMKAYKLSDLEICPIT